MAFWEVVAQHFTVQYVIKVDDDSYVRLDRLAIAVGQWQAAGAGVLCGTLRCQPDRSAVLRLTPSLVCRIHWLLQGQGQQREPPAAAHAPLV